MKFSAPIRYILIFVFMCTLIACKNTDKGNSTTNSTVETPIVIGNGVYYWKTSFEWNDYDQEFIDRHAIKRLYLRVFDVDYDKESCMSVPIATVRFKDKVPEHLEIVPVVYITTTSLKDIDYYTNDLYSRIRAIAKRNGFPKVREIQLDCDWTVTNKDLYFNLCKKIKSIASKDDITISATIRLHQLRQEAPPVDRGVLMLYNTGSIYNPSTENSILSSNDVKPYLRERIEYSIPLSVAYPTYAWGILIRKKQFMAILHKTDFSDESQYKKVKENIYEVIQEHYLENKQLHIGDKIRLEDSDMCEISAVQSMVKEKVSSIESVVLYHLDSLNMSKYSNEEIGKILK